MIAQGAILSSRHYNMCKKKKSVKKFSDYIIHCTHVHYTYVPGLGGSSYKELQASSSNPNSSKKVFAGPAGVNLLIATFGG